MISLHWMQSARRLDGLSVHAVFTKLVWVKEWHCCARVVTGSWTYSKGHRLEAFCLFFSHPTSHSHIYMWGWESIRIRWETHVGILSLILASLLFSLYLRGLSSFMTGVEQTRKGVWFDATKTGGEIWYFFRIEKKHCQIKMLSFQCWWYIWEIFWISEKLYYASSRL